MEFTEFKKALDTTTGSTGATLIPQVIDAYIIELARKLSPVSAIIPQKDWKNLTYTFKQRSSTAAGLSFGENDSWTINNNSYASQTVTMKISGNLGGVSNLLQEGSQMFVDALAAEIDGVTRGVAKYKENLILNGNSSTNSKQFSGIAAQLVTNTYYSSPSAPAQISFDLLDAMDDDVKSRGFGVDPSMVYWIMTPNMSTVVARLTAPFFRQDGNAMNLQGGFANTIYRNHRILESSAAEQVVKVSSETISTTGVSGQFKHNYVINSSYDDQLGNAANGGSPAVAPVVSVGGSVVSNYSISVNPFSGASVITFTTAPSAAVTATYFYKQQNIFLVDFSTIVMPVLHPLGFEQLPDPINVDQKVFRIKEYSCLAVEAEIGNALATEVYGATGHSTLSVSF